MPAKNAYLITGASSGIGLATALALRHEGYTVFGTVRRQADGRILKKAGGIPVLMDVTNLASIRRAHALVRRQLAGAPLSGLINNAGISVCIPWEKISLKDFRYQLEVNLIGGLAVTQTFLPDIQPHGGRMVFISSTAGRVAHALMGPYCCSKFAVEAMADSLRQELAGRGIRVITVQPGPIKTPIFAKTLTNAKHRYAAAFRQGAFGNFEAMSQELSRDALAPETIARVIVHLLQQPHPPARKLVARHAWLFHLIRALPASWLDYFSLRAIFPAKQP